MNYAKRANLAQKYPQPWEQSPEIIHDVMPKITEPVSPTASPLRGIIQAWTRYPKECLSNTAFNVKMATITLPTILRGSKPRELRANAGKRLAGSNRLGRRKPVANRCGPVLPRDVAILLSASASVHRWVGLVWFIALSTQFKTAGACK